MKILSYIFGTVVSIAILAPVLVLHNVRFTYNSHDLQAGGVGGGGGREYSLLLQASHSVFHYRVQFQR